MLGSARLSSARISTRDIQQAIPLVSEPVWLWWWLSEGRERDTNTASNMNDDIERERNSLLSERHNVRRESTKQICIFPRRHTSLTSSIFSPVAPPGGGTYQNPFLFLLITTTLSRLKWVPIYGDLYYQFIKDFARKRRARLQRQFLMFLSSKRRGTPAGAR